MGNLKKLEMYTIEDVNVFCDGLDHPECVAVHPDGTVWAGGEGGQIYQMSADGRKLNEVCNTKGFILGIAFSPDLTWMAICDLKNHCIWKLDLSSNALTMLASVVNGVQIQIPNYPVFDDNGNLYVSDSGGFRSVTGRIYRFDKSGRGEAWHPGPFDFPNGMALSADQKCLYVACTWLPGVERIEIGADGAAKNREVHVVIPKTCPDGLAIDEEGNVYISCYAPNRIYVLKKNESLETLIDDWESHTLCNPTNMAFGGEQFNELYFANLGRWHIGKLNLKVKGLKLACHKISMVDDRV